MTEQAARVAAPAALALFCVLGLLMTQRPLVVAAGATAVVVTLGVVLAVRRTAGWPLLLGLAVVAAALALLGHDQSSNLVWMGSCVVAAWVALTSPATVAFAAGGALCAVPVGEWVLDPSEPGWAAWFVGTAFTTVSCVFARRLRLTVAQLHEAQAQLAERTRAQERTRIAAEVHDVIGHALTVSLLHVSSARLALDDEPEQARRSLEEAERLARASLAEVRATVGLLRADGTGATTPLPGAADVPALVESFRAAGADVRLVVTGDLAGVAASRGLAAYRIVQEALTNATRHAAGRAVTVRLDVTGGAATVRVHNEGAPGGPAAPGAGLRGLQERAQAAGGRLTAGPDTTGWLVEAVLPA